MLTKLKYIAIWPLDALIAAQLAYTFYSLTVYPHSLFLFWMLAAWFAVHLISYAVTLFLLRKDIDMDYAGNAAILNRICWILLAGYVVCMGTVIVAIAVGGQIPLWVGFVTSALPLLCLAAVFVRDHQHKSQQKMWAALKQKHYYSDGVEASP